MALNFAGLLGNLQSMGFYDFVFPWLLFLVLLDVLLIKAPFWGEYPKKNQASVILAAIISFFIINAPFAGMSVGLYLTRLFGTAAIYLAGILVIVLFLGFCGYDCGSLFGGRSHVTLIILALLAIMIFYSVGAPAIGLSDELWTLIFVIAILGGAVMFLGEGGKKEGE